MARVANTAKTWSNPVQEHVCCLDTNLPIPATHTLILAHGTLLANQGLACVDAWDDTTDGTCSTTATRLG